jgi:hypothetical protein
MAAGAVLAYFAGRRIHNAELTLSLLLPALLASTIVAIFFLASSREGRGKWIEGLSGFWTLLTYLSLGVIPLLLRWHGSHK